MTLSHWMQSWKIFLEKLGKMVGINDWFQDKRRNHIHESILIGFPWNSDDAIVINYFILYAQYYIYLEKLKEKNKMGST